MKKIIKDMSGRTVLMFSMVFLTTTWLFVTMEKMDAGSYSMIVIASFGVITAKHGMERFSQSRWGGSYSSRSVTPKPPRSPEE